MKKLPLTGLSASFFCGALMTANFAFAGEELLVRTDMHFNECPAVISDMLQQLGANSNRVETTTDTGAHYFVELESVAADLHFRCNAVTEQFEVLRVTPGTLELSGATAG